MIEQLEQLDQQVFLFLNSFNSSFMDHVMYALSGKLIWAPLYLAILIYIAIKEKPKFFFILAFILLAVFLADKGSVLIKNMVMRPRPCHEPALEGLVYTFKERCGGIYGFVSSHASNAFNVALISILFIRKTWFTFFIIFWALVVGYTRIYLGLHYPGDVLCGSVYGALVGWLCYSLFVYADKARSVKRGESSEHRAQGSEQARLGDRREK